VHVNGKVAIGGVPEALTMSTIGSSQVMGFFGRLMNTLAIGGSSYLYYNRYSEIIYEGQTLNLFGIASYNGINDSWEISKLLALFKTSGLESDYLHGLIRDLLRTGFGLTFRSCLLGLFFSGFIWASRRLFRRLKATFLRVFKDRLQKADEQVAIADAPPVQREGVDHIDIESYTCTQCKREPRSIIFAPCKHCYLCKECYSQKINKS
jgi:hypothetical protein